jgi:hypothetical protein
MGDSVAGDDPVFAVLEGVPFSHRAFSSDSAGFPSSSFDGSGNNSFTSSITIGVRPRTFLTFSTTPSSRALRFFCTRVRAIRGGTVVAFVSGLLRKVGCTDVASPLIGTCCVRSAPLVRADAGSCHISSDETSVLDAAPTLATVTDDLRLAVWGSSALADDRASAVSVAPFPGVMD